MPTFDLSFVLRFSLGRSSSCRRSHQWAVSRVPSAVQLPPVPCSVPFYRRRRRLVSKSTYSSRRQRRHQHRAVRRRLSSRRRLPPLPRPVCRRLRRPAERSSEWCQGRRWRVRPQAPPVLLKFSSSVWHPTSVATHRATFSAARREIRPNRISLDSFVVGCGI